MDYHADRDCPALHQYGRNHGRLSHASRAAGLRARQVGGDDVGFDYRGYDDACDFDAFHGGRRAGALKGGAGNGL